MANSRCPRESGPALVQLHPLRRGGVHLHPPHNVSHVSEHLSQHARTLLCIRGPHESGSIGVGPAALLMPRGATWTKWVLLGTYVNILFVVLQFIEACTFMVLRACCMKRPLVLVGWSSRLQLSLAHECL